jgi:periplasmic copper chaperone A
MSDDILRRVGRQRDVTDCRSAFDAGAWRGAGIRYHWTFRRRRAMTKSLIPSIAAVILSLLAACASAQEVAVSHAWVRATVPGQRATGAFMELTSSSGAVLLAAASPVAEVVELHEMLMEGSTMRMRALARLELPAGRKVELRPGGYHVMLMDLRRTLKPGETVPITLTLEGTGARRTSIEVKAEVRDLAASGAGH